MKEFKRYSDEQVNQAYNADIVDFLRLQGYELKQTSSDELKVPHHEGLVITPSKNAWSWMSRPPAADQKSGAKCLGGVGAFSFCKRALEMSWLEAMQAVVGEAAEIKQFTPKAAAEPQEKKEFVMPEKSDNGYKNIYAYFINTRGISPETVREFANKGLIYPTVSKGVSKTTGNEYQKINAVFLHRNEQGQPCGADIQGIDQNPEYRFKGCTARDESDRGFVYDKGNPEKIDTVYLFEAPIDLMSFVELHPEIENAKFAALSGLKPNTAEPYINSDLKVVSCVDNDTAGTKFNNQILFSKMQESIGMGENMKTHTVQNGDIPINYCSAEVNGKEIGFFISKEDCFAAKELGAEVPKAAVSWINRSNFSINRECAEAGVKDFNDLLKKNKSAEKNTPSVDEKKFIARVNEMAEWAENVQNKATERLNDSRQENIR